MEDHQGSKDNAGRGDVYKGMGAHNPWCVWELSIGMSLGLGIKGMQMMNL